MVKSDKRVMVTATGYFPNIGGVENSLYYLSKGFFEKGYSVDLVASNSRLDLACEIPTFSRSEWADVYRYNYYFRGKKNALAGAVNAVRCYRKLRKNKYEVVVCRDHVSVVLLRISGIKEVIYVLPSVIKYQGLNTELSDVRGVRGLIKYFAGMYHHLVQKVAVRLAYKNYVFSDFMEKQVVEGLGFSRRIYRTVPGVDATKFSREGVSRSLSRREMVGLDMQDFVLLGLGRFAAVKGYVYAIKAMVHLPDNFKLLLVGEGPERNRYVELIENLSLGDRVKLFPKTFDPHEFYKLSDAFVLPSLYEPFGQTILEANSSGLPVVAFSNRVEGVNTATDEIVNDNTSVLANELTDYAFARAIRNMSDRLSAGLIRSDEVSSYVFSKFRWDGMVDDLLS